jgi:hypothetical protein
MSDEKDKEGEIKCFMEKKGISSMKECQISGICISGNGHHDHEGNQSPGDISMDSIEGSIHFHYMSLLVRRMM